MSVIDTPPESVPEVDGIPVRIVKGSEERLEASDLTSLQTYILAAGMDAFRILPQDRHRHRAVISGISGANLCILCKPNQVASAKQQGSGNAINGFQIISGMSLVYESAAELWVVPLGVLTISVLDERFSYR